MTSRDIRPGMGVIERHRTLWADQLCQLVKVKADDRDEAKQEEDKPAPADGRERSSDQSVSTDIRSFVEMASDTARFDLVEIKGRLNADLFNLSAGHNVRHKWGCAYYNVYRPVTKTTLEEARRRIDGLRQQNRRTPSPSSYGTP